MRQRVHYSGADLNPYLKKINRLLSETNLAPSRLSVMAGLGSSTLSNLIKRNNVPTLATLDKICAVLDIQLSDFIYEVEKEYPEMSKSTRKGITRFDPLSSKKDRLVEDIAALPLNDRNETIGRLLERYGHKGGDAGNGAPSKPGM